MDYERWCALSDGDLKQQNVAEVNLVAALGLPGAADLDVSAYVKRVDDWAGIVEGAVNRLWKQRARGEYSEFTDNQFRMLVMVTILQRNLGVTYNPASVSGEYDGRDSRNNFIHGPLGGHGGTCASLPFLYVAIGRRLGYPLFVVQAKEHLFVRWDREGERFNVEATARGFLSYDDDHYRLHPKPLSESDLRAFPQFLRSMTLREELACCLIERSRVLFDNLQLPEAVKASYFANQLSSFYYGAWSATSMAHVIVSRIQRLDRNLPWPVLVDMALPKSRTPKEIWATRTARKHLLRQFTIRHSENTSPSDIVFSQNI